MVSWAVSYTRSTSRSRASPITCCSRGVDGAASPRAPSPPSCATSSSGHPHRRDHRPDRASGREGGHRSGLPGRRRADEWAGATPTGCNDRPTFLPWKRKERWRVRASPRSGRGEHCTHRHRPPPSGLPTAPRTGSHKAQLVEKVEDRSPRAPRSSWKAPVYPDLGLHQPAGWTPTVHLGSFSTRWAIPGATPSNLTPDRSRIWCQSSAPVPSGTHASWGTRRGLDTPARWCTITPSRPRRHRVKARCGGRRSDADGVSPQGPNLSAFGLSRTH